MPTNNLLHIDSPNNRLRQPEEIDLQKLFFRMLSHWHFFAIAIVMALISAWLYNRYAPVRYRVVSTLLIEEDKKGGATLGTDKLLEGFGLRSGMQNLDNQMLILSSWSLIGKTLDSLPFGTEYYYRGHVKKAALYPKHPIRIIQDSVGALPFDTEFKFTYLDNNKFILEAESGRSYKLKKQASFGEKIIVNSGTFRIECIDYNWFIKNPETLVFFVIHSHTGLLEDYKKRLKVEAATREATIVNLSLEGDNKEMDIDFLNKLSVIFINYNLDKKNKEANRTVDFIDKQLVGITDSLSITEENLQKFRSKKMVMNLSAQGQVIIDQAMKLENEKARLMIESNYYNYLADYLSKDNIGEVPIAPATMGITDAGLTKLVMDLTELQGQYYSRSLGEKNPMQGQLAQRLKNTKDALKETLNGVKQANELAKMENRDQIITVNSKAAALPVTEKELLGIERQFKLNDVLYTFLLEKKSEAQIQKASNTPDNEIIDPAKPDKQPVFPKTNLNYLLAILAGMGFPFLWITLADFMNFRIRAEEDIIKITDIPVAGQIPHSRLQSQNVVSEEPDSQVTEAFRALRSKMQYFIKEKKSPVILITSSMPAEGKTFTAINLAVAYSLLGKKTVLVGFDLRKPKIYSDFGIPNDKGVSTWLIGQDVLEEVLKVTKCENLSIIPAGPSPPNPSELTSSTKTNELFYLLKEKFDYIIVDSPPIGTVSDTFYLATLADTCLMIVRQNFTLKYLLEATLNEMKISSIKNISIVVNDIDQRVYGHGYRGQYGYVHGYGYSYDKMKFGLHNV